MKYKLTPLTGRIIERSDAAEYLRRSESKLADVLNYLTDWAYCPIGTRRGHESKGIAGICTLLRLPFVVLALPCLIGSLMIVTLLLGYERHFGNGNLTKSPSDL